MRRPVAVRMAILVAAPVWADFYDVPGLKRDLNPGPLAAPSHIELLMSQQALGYLQGIFDSLRTQRLICSADAVTGEQLKSVVFDYLKMHPEKDQSHAAPVVMTALAKAFPCSNKRSSSSRP